MYNEIVTVIKSYKNKKFSGHVKIGIELGSIVSIGSTNVYNPLAFIDDEKEEVFNELKKISRPNYYGCIELSFNEGELNEFSWYKNLKGKDLKEELLEMADDLQKLR